MPAGQSEDCLYLSVYAPAKASPTSNLPVFFFIQGGGFNANANPNLDGTGLVKASGDGIIVVTLNYRVGAYGFLASSASGSTGPSPNNGLKDQRKALQWVQTYISRFGGNPGHVVLGGNSAGAASISLHMVAYDGRNEQLFHGAAAESVSFAPVLTNVQSQFQYDNLAKAVGCKDQDPAQSLKCLQSKSTAELQAHNRNIPHKGQSQAPLFSFGPTIDDDFLTDVVYNLYAQGKFINVPTIVGDDTNGGTIFVPTSTSSQMDSNAFLSAQFPDLTKSQLETIAKLYPVPKEGWWRQTSNVYGEMRYMCPSLYINSAVANASATLTRRSQSPRSSEGSLWHMLERRKKRIGILTKGSKSRPKATNAGKGNGNSYSGSGSSSPSTTTTTRVRSWAYRYNVEDSEQMSKGLGVPHTVELNAIFGPSHLPRGTSTPASYQSGGTNANVVPVIQAYWTSFIRSLDPNTHRAPGSARWGSYYSVSGVPQRLVFQNDGITQMEDVDSGLRSRCAYLQSIGPSIKQ